MSVEVARLKGVITMEGLPAADRGLRNLDSRLKETANSADASARRIGGSMRGLGNVFSSIAGVAGGNVLTSVLGKIAGAMDETTKIGVDYKKTLQNASLAFEQLTGSAGAAAKHIADLQQIALKTPFEFEDITAASLKLQAFGYSSQQVAAFLPKLSDAASVAAAGTGDFKGALDGVILALGQMRAKGKVSLEEINQLTERGVPALEILAQKLGKTTAQTTKLIESGRVRGGPAVEALIEGFGERYGGVSDKLSRTLAGKESNYQDLFKQRAAVSAEAFFGEYNARLDKALADPNATAADMMATQFTNSIIDKFAQIGKSATELTPLKSAGQAIGTAIAKGIGIGTSGPEIEDAIAGTAADAILFFKKMLGIQSPSKVFEELGALTAEGYALGLESGAGRVGRALSVMLGGGRVAGRGYDRTPEENKQRAAALADDPRIKAFLDTLAKAEGADYNTLFGGGKFSSFAGFPDWPGKPFTYRRKDGSIGRDFSRASGRYQFIPKTWRSVSSFLGLTDFSPRSQDIAAAELLRQRGAIPSILNGDIAGAMTRTNEEWASLPGSPHGQPTRKASTLIDYYNKSLSALTGAAAPIMQIVEPVRQIAQALTGRASRPGDGAFATPFARNLGGFGAITAVQDPIAVLTEIKGALDPVPLNEYRGSVELNTDRITRMRAELEALTPPLEMAAAKTRDWAKEILGGDAFDLTESLETLGKNLGGDIDSTLASILAGGDWREGVKGIIGNFAQGLLQSIQGELISKLSGGAHSSIGGWLGSIAGSALSGLFGGFGLGVQPGAGAPAGARASGGPVTGGLPYLVGERGPELFTPGVSGEIISNKKSNKWMDILRSIGGILGGPARGALGAPSLPGKWGGILQAIGGGLGFGGGASPGKGGGGFLGVLTGALGGILGGGLFGGGILGLAGIGGGLLSGLAGKRASGGPVLSGGNYLVGERGPETFVPHGAGRSVILQPTYIINAPNMAVARESAAQIDARNAALVTRAMQRNA